MSARRGTRAMAAGAAALLGFALLLQVARDRRYATPGAESDAVLYVPSGSVMQRIALEYTAIAADVDWIRAVQHYGGDHRSRSPREKYRLLYALLDRATSLDPRFNIAYRFGAIFLAEPYPIGAGRPDLAIALLEKGLVAQPQRWEYHEDIGFVYYWQLHDYRKAAKAFETAARIPGAPWWLRTTAAVILARGGDRTTSRELWRHVLEGADSEGVRQQAQLRLAQLDAMDQIDALHRIVGRYYASAGRLPDSWLALHRTGLLRGTGAPVDPTGEPYQLDASTGTVSLSPTSPLRPLPTEPPGVGPAS
jgi:tetratricopeptide (TPR) repeat protein